LPLRIFLLLEQEAPPLVFLHPETEERPLVCLLLEPEEQLLHLLPGIVAQTLQSSLV
jgi:hypothetical protein